MRRQRTDCNDGLERQEVAASNCTARLPQTRGYKEREKTYLPDSLEFVKASCTLRSLVGAHIATRGWSGNLSTGNQG